MVLLLLVLMRYQPAATAATALLRQLAAHPLHTLVAVAAVHLPGILLELVAPVAVVLEQIPILLVRREPLTPAEGGEVEVTLLEAAQAVMAALAVQAS